MKKGQELVIEVVGMEFPNKAYGYYNEKKVYPIGNYIIGHKLKGTVTKVRNKKIELKKIEVLEKGKNEIVPECDHFNLCGGCTFQNLSYENQLNLKRELVLKMIRNSVGENFEFEEIVKSPVQFEYRNKMEFSFGNEMIDGPLTLGMHRKGSFHDVITVTECKLMDSDFRKILKMTVEYFSLPHISEKIYFYHRLKHEGYLRNMVIRKGEKTGEISVNLVTTSQSDFDLSEWAENLLQLPLKNRIVGIIHTVNDNLSDSVLSERENILYGKRDINEKIFDLNFNISPYSFFQTNSGGVELLYGKVLEYVKKIEGKNEESRKESIIFDLFSGTGTIGQIVAKRAKYVYGIELVEEAVKKANENAELNNIDNVEFIAGDVFEKLDMFKEKNVKPDIIILDPPRPGVGEKTLLKLLEYNVENVIYVSCNPKTFIEDLKVFKEKGYNLEKASLVDMFPQTPHVEVITLLSKLNSKNEAL